MRELGEGSVRERGSLVSYKTNCNLIEKCQNHQTPYLLHGESTGVRCKRVRGSRDVVLMPFGWFSSYCFLYVVYPFFLIQYFQYLLKKGRKSEKDGE